MWRESASVYREVFQGDPMDTDGHRSFGDISVRAVVFAMEPERSTPRRCEHDEPQRHGADPGFSCTALSGRCRGGGSVAQDLRRHDR